MDPCKYSFNQLHFETDWDVIFTENHVFLAGASSAFAATSHVSLSLTQSLASLVKSQGPQRCPQHLTPSSWETSLIPSVSSWGQTGLLSQATHSWSFSSLIPFRRECMSLRLVKLMRTSDKSDHSCQRVCSLVFTRPPCSSSSVFGNTQFFKNFLAV